MGIATLGVTGEGASKEWNKVGGLTVANTMNSDDGGTSFFNNDGETGMNDFQGFVFDAMPGGVVQITTHKAYFKAAKRSGSNKTVLPSADLGGWGDGASQSLTVQGSYVLFDRTDMKTGTPSVAQMDAGELRLKHIAGATGDVGWTYAYWEVTYALGAGGFVQGLGEWIPPLLGLCSGAGLLFREVYKELKSIQLINTPRTITESIERHKAGEKRIMSVLPCGRQEWELIKNALLTRKRYCFVGR